MTDFRLALASAVLWAVSAPIVGMGLERLSSERRVVELCAALQVALLAGTLALAIPSFWVGFVPPNVPLALAGVFTFPLATGCYYLTAHAFSKRAEIASVFSKVKPLFSVALSVAILGEPLTIRTSVSAGLVCVGVCILLTGSNAQGTNRAGIGWGLTTASLWALGELFFGLGARPSHELSSSFAALCVGCLMFLPIGVPALAQVVRSRRTSTLWPFALHGFLSFGVAYAFFFSSIVAIGLARTALITAMWPALAFFLALVFRALTRRDVRVHAAFLWASAFLFGGALVQIF